MNLLSLDIETTGLCHYSCDIIEIGAIFFNTDTHTKEDLARSVEFNEFSAIQQFGKVVTFSVVIENDGACWEEGAWELHKDWYPDAEKVSYDNAMDSFEAYLRFVTGGRRVSLAGANVSAFDRKFLPPNFDDFFKTRALDIGSLYFDGHIPSLGEITGGPVRHRALEDARDVAKLILNKCEGY